MSNMLSLDLGSSWCIGTEPTSNRQLMVSQPAMTAGPGTYSLKLAPLLFVLMLPFSTPTSVPTPFFDRKVTDLSIDTQFSALPPAPLRNWAQLTQISRSEMSVVHEHPSESSRALRSFEYVRAALDATNAETGQVVGISPNTVRNWREARTTPYPSSTRTLYSVEATLRSLGRTMSTPLSDWLREPEADGPSPASRLLRGDTVGFYAAASAVLYGVGRRLPPSTHLLQDSGEQLDIGTVPEATRTAIFTGRARVRKRS
jgi:DNA-binding transcriptional regulator YiaG